MSELTRPGSNRKKIFDSHSESRGHAEFRLERRPSHSTRTGHVKKESVASFERRHGGGARSVRSEEHTSELQSHSDLVCRLLLEKTKTIIRPAHPPEPEQKSLPCR